MPDYLLMAAVPASLLIGSAVGARRMRLDRREDLGLRLPGWRAAAIVAVLFLLLSILSEVAYRRFGLDEGTGDWRGRYEPAALAVRVVFAALIYPVAEEVFFRGFLFGLLRRRLGEIGAVAGTAVAFTALHLQYDWRGLLLVFADAVFFGLVRSRTGSVPLTVGLHVLANGYAVWQRL